jgi:hypothetical protein
VLTRCKECADLVDDGVTGASRGRWSDVKEAEELREALTAEGDDDEGLSPGVLPLHVHTRKGDNAHEDVHGDEQPYLLSTRLPCGRRVLAVGIGCGVRGDGSDRLFGQQTLEEAELSVDVMDGQLGSRSDRQRRSSDGCAHPRPRGRRGNVLLLILIVRGGGGGQVVDRLLIAVIVDVRLQRAERCSAQIEQFLRDELSACLLLCKTERCGARSGAAARHGGGEQEVGRGWWR